MLPNKTLPLLILSLFFLMPACCPKGANFKKVDIGGINFFNSNAKEPGLQLNTQEIQNIYYVGGRRLRHQGNVYCFYWNGTDGEGDIVAIFPKIDREGNVYLSCDIEAVDEYVYDYDGKISVNYPDFELDKTTPQEIQKVLGKPTKQLDKYDEKVFNLEVYDEILFYADLKTEKAKECKDTWSQPGIMFLFKNGKLTGASQSGWDPTCRG